MIELLQDCPKCKAQESCYISLINETKNGYSCFECGYQTNDLMIEGEFDFTEFESTLPELHKACKFTDESGRVWYPMTINISDKGTVFLNGTSKDDCYFSSIKTKPLTSKEMKMPRWKGQTHKSDTETLKSFGLTGFYDALESIGFFDVNEESQPS